MFRVHISHGCLSSSPCFRRCPLFDDFEAPLVTPMLLLDTARCCGGGGGVLFRDVWGALHLARAGFRANNTTANSIALLLLMHSLLSFRMTILCFRHMSSSSIMARRRRRNNNQRTWVEPATLMAPRAETGFHGSWTRLSMQRERIERGKQQNQQRSQ